MKTVREVIEMLEDFDPNDRVVVSLEDSEYTWEVESMGIDAEDDVNMICKEI